MWGHVLFWGDGGIAHVSTIAHSSTIARSKVRVQHVSTIALEVDGGGVWPRPRPCRIIVSRRGCCIEICSAKHRTIIGHVLGGVGVGFRHAWRCAPPETIPRKFYLGNSTSAIQTRGAYLGTYRKGLDIYIYIGACELCKEMLEFGRGKREGLGEREKEACRK